MGLLDQLLERLQRVHAAQAQTLRDISSFLQGVGSVLKFVGAVVDEEFGVIISAVGSGASYAGTILSFFNGVLNPNSSVADQAIITLQYEINQAILEIQQQIQETSLLGRMQDVDIAFTPVSTEFQNLQYTIGTTDAGIIYASLTNCLNSVRALRGDDLWSITWLPRVTYLDSWDGDAIPPHDQTVFSYVYILPKFIQAIGMFLTVIAALEPSALDPSYPGPYFAELVACLLKLQDVDDKMTKVRGTPWGSGTVSGIIGTKLPSTDDVAELIQKGDLDEWTTNWQNVDPAIWTFGAVEPYSGVNNVDSYFPFMFDHKIYPGAVPDSVLRLLNLRIENLRKSLYTKLGLPAVRHTIRLLQALTGQPIPASPYTDSCGFPLPTYDSWSFRCAFSILGLSRTSLRGLWAFLQTIPPYSGGMEYPLASNFPPEPLPSPRSFRAIFIPPVSY